MVVCGHFVVNCVHVCVLTQLVAIASKCTDLHVCAFYNYNNIIMTELSCRVSLYTCSFVLQYRKETALHAASEYGHVNVASSLLQHGAVVNSYNYVRLLYVSMHGEHGVSQIVSNY